MTKAFKQTIMNVQGSTALVKSQKGNVYPVIISDFVRMKRKPKVKDIALIKRTNGKYYMVDVLPKPNSDETNIPPEQMGYNY